MANHPSVQQFIQLVESWNFAGFAEYMLWRAVEGNPLGIWASPEIVTPEIMELLKTLRDDLKIWPFWSPADSSWDTVGIPAWRAHAATVHFNDLIARLRSRL